MNSLDKKKGIEKITFFGRSGLVRRLWGLLSRQVVVVLHVLRPGRVRRQRRVPGKRGGGGPSHGRGSRGGGGRAHLEGRRAVASALAGSSLQEFFEPELKGLADGCDDVLRQSSPALQHEARPDAGTVLGHVGNKVQGVGVAARGEGDVRHVVHEDGLHTGNSNELKRHTSK